MHARRSRSEWSSIIKAFERAGGSQEEFCSKRGLNLGSFRGWLYRLRKAGEATPEVALVPVTVTETVSSPYEPVCEAGREIVVVMVGMDVHIPPGTDIAYAAALVAELRARC